MEEYLKSFHDEDVTDLLNNTDDSLHVSIKINLTTLYQQNRDLFFKLIHNPHKECLTWNLSLLETQKALIEGNMFLEPGYQIKENCYVRFVNLPNFDGRPTTLLPNAEDVGKFLQVKGNIVRMSKTRLLELKREFICSKCKQKVTIMAEYSKMFVIEGQKTCKADFCKGMLYPVQSNPKPEFCIDYQEVRIQEIMSDRNIPSSMIVTFENDLVDLCQPGDCVTVCGTVERRWKPLMATKKAEVVVTMRAISIVKEEIVRGRDLPEQLICVRAQWIDTIQRIGELNARDLILNSIAPEVHGMLLPKLAVALLLCSGVERYQSRGTSIRGNSHVLLVGDPGLAKTKLLKHAAKISRRSVYTTGMGCSQAGLTAAAIRESNEWQLEAGALVLADGGICCIDEFNLMRETDKGSIHEAMEQQSVSMAKAGVVCKLSTRCSVLAATNSKKGRSLDIDEMGYVDVGIASPLLSRFDIVLLLRDPCDQDWDDRIADHILEIKTNQISSNIMSLDDLQSHFLAIKSIHPEVTPEANQLLGTYYKFCRSDRTRDPGRTTMRLLDSLIRLSQSHARLLFKPKVTIRDAATVIMLVESSLGFGKLLPQLDTLRMPLPLGPSNNEIKEILNRLELDFDPKDYEENRFNNDLRNEQFVRDTPHASTTSNINNGTRSAHFPISNHENLDEFLNIELGESVRQPVLLKSADPDTMNDCLNIDFPVPNLRSSPPLIFKDTKKPKRKTAKARRRPIIDEDENLDEILDLNDFNFDNPAKPSTSKTKKLPKRSYIENESNLTENKKSKKPPVQVPQDDINNLDNILSGIQKSFLPTQTQKNLQLSTTQDIDLDEIFGDSSDDDVNNGNKPTMHSVPNQPTSYDRNQYIQNPSTNNSITSTVQNSTQFSPISAPIPSSYENPIQSSFSLDLNRERALNHLASSTQNILEPTRSSSPKQNSELSSTSFSPKVKRAVLSDATMRKLNLFRYNSPEISPNVQDMNKTETSKSSEKDSAIEVDKNSYHNTISKINTSARPNIFGRNILQDDDHDDDDLSFLNLDF